MGGLVESEVVLAIKDDKADFLLGLYGLDVKESKIEREVKAYLAEKLLKPRVEELWIGRDGSLDPDYLAMMQRAIDYWGAKGDIEAVARFESELTGMRNLAYLVIESGTNGLSLPVVVNASDPGSFYVGENGAKRSATFVGLLDKAEDNGWKYRIFSLPTRYIGLYVHKQILWQIGDIVTTQKILGASLEDLTANNLVAFPVLLDQMSHSIDELAHLLGYESWNDVENMATDQLVLEGDLLAKERREVMIQEFTGRILDLVRGEKTKEEKEALVNAMADMFALEAGSEYLGWDSERIREEIKKNVRVTLAERLGVFSRTETLQYYSTQYDLGDLNELYVQARWMMNAFRNNLLAQESRATGCGGAGANYGSGLDWNRSSSFNYEYTTSGFEMMQPFGYQDGTTTISQETESTGKYKEYYDYKPGVCAHCHEHRRYVAYPKSPDTPCAGWCSLCEK